MKHKKDATPDRDDLIQCFVEACSRRFMTLEDMGLAVGRTKMWASKLVGGKIRRVQFNTRGRIEAFLRGQK